MGSIRPCKQLLNALFETNLCFDAPQESYPSQSTKPA